MASNTKRQRRYDFPVDRTREHPEPRPIVMISSAYKGERNIMTLGWHMMLEAPPVFLTHSTHFWSCWGRSGLVAELEQPY
jgi:hypothetical protein